MQLNTCWETSTEAIFFHQIRNIQGTTGSLISAAHRTPRSAQHINWLSYCLFSKMQQEVQFPLALGDWVNSIMQIKYIYPSRVSVTIWLHKRFIVYHPIVCSTTNNAALEMQIYDTSVKSTCERRSEMKLESKQSHVIGTVSSLPSDHVRRISHEPNAEFVVARISPTTIGFWNTVRCVRITKNRQWSRE